MESERSAIVASLQCQQQTGHDCQVESPSQLPQQQTGCGMFILLSSLTAALSGLLMGYELSIISGAMLQLKSLLTLTCQEQEIVVSALLIGALLASLVGGILIDHYGRRITILMTAWLLVLANLFLIIIASYGVLIVGRICIGIAISLSSVSTCVYLAEIAPQHKRGLLVSLNELMIVIGILFAYIANYAFASISHGWQYMFGIVIPLAAIQALAVYFLPPSPRFLVKKGKDEAASKVLQRLRATTNTTEELTAIKSSIKAEHQYTFLDLFSTKDKMRSRMLIGLSLGFFVQITGQPNILYYASTVLKSVGFQSNEAATLASIGIGIVKVLSTIPALLFVDKVGSKTFLCIGSAAMATSLVILSLVTLKIDVDFGDICKNYTPVNQSLEFPSVRGSINFTAINMSLGEEITGASLRKDAYSTPRDLHVYKQFNWTTASMNTIVDFNTKEPFSQTETGGIQAILKWLCLASLLVFVASFSIGLGPMSWLLLSELFPVGIKGRAFALTFVTNWGVSLIISLTFLTLTELIGLPWMFFIYSIMSLALLVFTIIFIPETKGRTLEEISEDLAKQLRVNRWARRRKSLLPMELVPHTNNPKVSTE